MADSFEASVVLEIEKKTDGPIRAGTVYASTVKDAGIKTQREFELAVVERPTRIAGGSSRTRRSSFPRVATTSSPRGREPGRPSSTSSKDKASAS
jgi:hypothetical protein